MHRFGGARGETATEMGQALRLTQGAHGSVAALLNKLRAPEVRIANRLFVVDGLQMHAAFEDLLSAKYRTTSAPLSLPAINAWVAAETGGHLRDLLPREAITGESKMALVNTVYFRARWEVPFVAEATRPHPFHV